MTTELEPQTPYQPSRKPYWTAGKTLALVVVALLIASGGVPGLYLAIRPNSVNPTSPAPNCANDATNYPSCNHFNPCSNGANNPPYCNTFNPCSNGATNPPRCTLQQGITGNATLFPVSPLCGPQPPSRVSGPSLVINSTEEKSLRIIQPLNWTLYGCSMSTQFRIELNPGNYSVTLSGFGSLYNLPITVDVHAGVFAKVVINIYTGVE